MIIKISNLLSKNLIANSFNQILGVGFPIIIQYYLIRHLRIEDIGYWAIITSVKSLVLLSITFFTIYLIKVIADENNKNSESVYLSNTIVLTYLTMIIPVFLFLGYMIYQYKDLEQYIYISLIPVLTTPLGMDFYFQAKLKNDYLLYRKLFVKLIVLVCLFLFVKSENDFIVYVWIISLSLSFEHLVNFYFIKKHIDLKTIKLSVIKDIFKNSIGYLPFNITYNQLPAISIVLGAYFLDIKTLAVITILLKVINLITTFVSSSVMVLFPLKIKLSTSSLKESFNDNKYLSYTILLSLAIITCLIFSKKLVFYIFLHNYTMPNLEIEFIILSSYILIHSVYNYFVFNYYLTENKSIYISWLNIIILIVFVAEIFLFNLFNIEVYFAFLVIIPPAIVLIYLSYKLSLNNKTS
jgi:O-antigen/teichoic acid export membrane protein